jgi:hypothetical protein
LLGKTGLLALGLSLLSLTAAAGASLVGRGKPLDAVGYLTVAVATVAFVILSVTIWTSSESVFGVSDWRPVEYALLVAFGTGIVSALLASTSDADNGSIRLTRAIALLAIVALVLIAIAEVASPSLDIDPRVISTIAVLFIAGTILTALERISLMGRKHPL